MRNKSLSTTASSAVVDATSPPAVRTRIRAGKLSANHSLATVRSGIRAGKLSANHSLATVRSGIRAGRLAGNHIESMSTAA